jgi:hypothetical protein
MLHLPAERLAALADSEPTPSESEHLTICARCAGERAAYGRLLAQSMDERRRIGPPLNTWEALSAKLEQEGLVRPSTTTVVADTPRRTSTVSWTRVGVRIAAGLLLAVGSGIAGRVSAGASPLPFGASNNVGADVTATTTDSAGGFSSSSDALAVLSNSQRDYERAAAYLAAHDTSGASEEASDRYRTRLAALDQLANTSREALNESPEDPYLNQSYLFALGAREATLRQLGAALPAGTRLMRF